MNEKVTPLSACIEHEENSPVGTMHEFYLGWLDMKAVAELYDYPVRVIYEKGYQDEQITRVSWGIVQPHKIIEVTDE